MIKFGLIVESNSIFEIWQHVQYCMHKTLSPLLLNRSIVELGILSFRTIKQITAESARADLLPNLLQIWAIFGYCYGLSYFVGISPVVSAAFLLPFCQQTQLATNWIFKKMSFVSNFLAEFILDDVYELLATKVIQILIPLEQQIFSLSVGSKISKDNKDLLQGHLNDLNSVLKEEKQSRKNSSKQNRLRGLYAGAALHGAATSGIADDAVHGEMDNSEVLFSLEQLKSFYRKYIPQQVYIILL